jgi:hypothetical protein
MQLTLLFEDKFWGVRSFARCVHHSFDNFYQIVGQVDALGFTVGMLNLLFGLLLSFNLPINICWRVLIILLNLPVGMMLI